MSEPLFDVPNLDSMDRTELAELSHVFAILANYANNKSNAMLWRSRGAIDAALRHERSADNCYHNLPQWARW